MSITLDELWIQIDRRLNECDAEQREDWRKVLVRRLKHPEVGAQPQSTPLKYVHPLQRSGPKPRIDSPLCQCGCTRKAHAEDGSCLNCICPMFVSA